MIVPTHLSQRDPRRFALQVLADCEVTQPPIDEQRVLHYFRGEVVRTSFNARPGCEHLATERRGRPSGMLVKTGDDAPPLLWVSPDVVSAGRFRWTVFHELGHHDLGHEGELFVDGERTLRPAEGRTESLPTEYRQAGLQAVLPDAVESADGMVMPIMVETADSARRKEEEREANLYASEMIMPSQWFAPEARDLPTSIETVQHLRTRYNASLEATAIRYAQACPEKCAVLAVEPTRDAEGIFTGFTTLYVRRASRGFLRGLRQEAQLPFSGLLAAAWNTEDSTHVAGTVTADLLGLGSRVEVRADAMRLGSYGRVLALLWLESGQLLLLPEQKTQRVPGLLSR